MPVSRSFTIRLVPLTSLVTDGGYQRERINSLIANIVAHFDPAQWDLPKAAARPDETYGIVAGQHRVEAARELLAQGKWPFDYPEGMIEVQVVSGLESREEEADLYLKDANNTKNLSPYDKHNAKLVRDDADAIDIQTVLDLLGIPLVRRQRKVNGRSLVAITAMYQIWNKGQRLPENGGYVLLNHTLRLATMWDPDDIFRYDGFLLQGLAVVILETLLTGGKITRIERFVKRDKPITIAGHARRWANSRGMSTNIVLPYAEAIRERMA